MKRAHEEEEEVKDTNLLVLPSLHDHYIMWLTRMICPEWPREIVTHQIMPQLCGQENIMYCYLGNDFSQFFRHRPPQNRWDWFNVYYTPLIELRDKGNGVTLCGDLWPTHLYVQCNDLRVIVSDPSKNDKRYDITEEMTYYALCRQFIDSQSLCGNHDILPLISLSREGE